MPLRRRRDGAAVQARTEEQSSARVRVPARRKAPRSLRRRHPSRGGVRGRSRPARRVTRVLQPPRRIEPVTRVPEAPREGHAHIVQERAARLCSSASARDLSRPRKWNASHASRCIQVAARRLPVRQRIAEANATGIGWCRRVAGRKLHSRARVDSSKGVPARRIQVAEVGKRRRGSKKRDSRWQRGTWTGARPSGARKGIRG